MSKLTEKLNADMKQAMKDDNKIKKGVITLLKAGIQNEAKEQRVENLKEDEEIAIVRRELKQTKDSMAEYAKGNRHDLVAIEEQKIKIIEAYLPMQMTEEEIMALLKGMEIDKTTAKPGKLTGEVMKMTAGNADGKLVGKVISEFLGQ